MYNFVITIVIFVDTGLTNKILMFMSLIIIFIAGAINSAIERFVDFVTLEYNELAGKAKDVESSIVFKHFSLCYGMVYCVI
ncbi:diacylglycerol kinase [Campylobacter pinnipediorum]|uniref:diacylglycerol kinase n=1 Tax=Campylobacter pinnipediorum TaxID=1965231 RepID=UPI001D04496D|nr:diacylglycerol kinase [Campylobacter pinnipediorum]